MEPKCKPENAVETAPARFSAGMVRASMSMIAEGARASPRPTATRDMHSADMLVAANGRRAVAADHTPTAVGSMREPPARELSEPPGICVSTCMHGVRVQRPHMHGRLCQHDHA
eukprot:349785-Chlamydomonas_euryale.AAC.10